MTTFSLKHVLAAWDARELDLKWALVGRIALIAILCAAGAAAYAMHDVAAKTRQRNGETAGEVHKQLRLQLLRIERAADIPVRFPDWEIVTRYALQPGQCVQLIPAETGPTRSSCVGVEPHALAAPDWFATLYRSLFFAGSTVRLPLEHQGSRRGIVEADIDPHAVVGSAWIVLKQVSGALAAMTVVLCVLVYGAVAHALRPANEILVGIDRVAQGDLAWRLPSFRLRELRRIATVFNALAGHLQLATRERAELARRLIDAQEQERRWLSLELHDDVAQRLTALSLLARSIQDGARSAAPSVSAESAELASMASDAVRALRITLASLRPPEIDDLGLRIALRSLIAAQAQRAGGRIQVALRADAQVDRLPSEAAAHVYRIVQEGLTNAVRHAAARNVAIALNVVETDGGADVRLDFADDGSGAPAEVLERPRPGLGLLGMRDRVHALGGQIVTETSPGGGFRLRVRFRAALAAREVS
ncbi:sensor histidine kinase [Methylobacterium sp.]|uniref:HAMP domain-containing sensor histidine kinase n=1 Tax=Methylobacterium sp. TaxID=409 RepID=UPI00040A862C|nr:sensor histidine kinase [Methylobacterium sp.]RUP22593.1 MAG: sensor histidine kinase [Methylobacterium sp.]